MAGKKVIGHNLTAKMTDFGLYELIGSKKSWTETVEIAKVFNLPTDESQQPFPTLCEKYLNLIHRKRPTPCFAVSIFEQVTIF